MNMQDLVSADPPTLSEPSRKRLRTSHAVRTLGKLGYGPPDTMNMVQLDIKTNLADFQFLPTLVRCMSQSQDTVRLPKYLVPYTTMVYELTEA